MTLREHIAQRLFGDIIKAGIDRAVNAKISVRVDDGPGWDPLSGGGPNDRPWAELREDLDDALEAWRKNFMIRRIVTLTRSYVVGNGIDISSKHAWVEGFVRRFWDHPMNQIDQRLGPMCDELVRSGELFVILFTNKVDGMSYIRFVPASRIREVETDKDDYEKELRYGQIQETSSDLKWWLSPEHPDATKITKPGSPNPEYPPIMYHYAINKPIGATRGESDLATILKWALRYSSWLEDRVRLNRVRTRQGMLDIEIDDDSQVEAKKYQLKQDNPLRAGIYVHGKGETTTLHDLKIQADNAEPDGKALRLAIAAGSSTALHYLGEGGDVNYATARAMGEPTARFHSERQEDLIELLLDLITLAYQRYRLVTGGKLPADGDLKLVASVTEVAREDNASLALAAKDAVAALAQMRAHGWTDDATAIRLAFKFAGETLTEEEIVHILETVEPLEPVGAPVPAPSDGKENQTTQELQHLNRRMDMLNTRPAPEPRPINIHPPNITQGDVTVNLPAQEPQEINITMPEQPAPTIVLEPLSLTLEAPIAVDVAAPEAPEIKVDLHLPAQEAADININIEAELKMPDTTTETETIVERDPKTGRIDQTTRTARSRST